MSNQEEPIGSELVIQHTGQVFSLTQETVTIGSGEDNLIILDDPQVSAHHATITWQAEANVYLIEDWGSAEGTYVNEIRIDEPQPLRQGDIIRVGNTIIEVRLDAAVGVPPPVAEPEAKGTSPVLAGILIALLVGITVICVALFAVVLFGSGGGRGVPTVAIQSPADDAQVTVGGEIILQATASGAKDITVLELSVDGNLVAAETSPDPNGSSSLTSRKAWTFLTPGEHVVSAVARTASGKASKTESVEVLAVSSGTEVTPGVRPSATPTTEPGEPTNTPEPTPTVTNTPEPGETVPPPPQIEYFQASPSSITAGGCATLQWGKVSNATEARIDPDVGGVGTPGDTQVCPMETTTYILTATGPGGTTQASTTVTVIGGLPDLTVDSINFVPMPPVEGQDAEVQIAISNQGAGPAGAFKWEWDAGSEGLFDGRVYGLREGETRVVTVLWTPSQTYASLSTEARVDVDNEVPESDEGNNQLAATVQVIPAPSTPETAMIQSDGSLDGYWTSGDNGGTGDILVGNNAVVTGTQGVYARGFMSFDLSVIPPGSTIQSVELRFYQQQVEGDPYSKLGRLTLEHVVYTAVDASAFNTPAMASVQVAEQTVPGAWYILSDPTFVTWIQEDVDAGRSGFQLRLRFPIELDNDDEDDWISIAHGGGFLANPPVVTVTYLP
jgi:pSer/pThr/pTyr-binding forkhead associated (FHA) protein